MALDEYLLQEEGVGERKQVEWSFFFLLRRKYHWVQTLLLHQMSFQSSDLGFSSDRFLLDMVAGHFGRGIICRGNYQESSAEQKLTELG